MKNRMISFKVTLNFKIDATDEILKIYKECNCRTLREAIRIWDEITSTEENSVIKDLVFNCIEEAIDIYVKEKNSP